MPASVSSTNRVMRLASVKSETVASAASVLSSGNAGSCSSTACAEGGDGMRPELKPATGASAVVAGGLTDESEGGGRAAIDPQVSRAVASVMRRWGVRCSAPGDVPRPVRCCPGGPVRCSLRARFMPSGCAPTGPGCWGRRRPCGKRSRKPDCGDRNDSEYRRIDLGSRLSPVVASPPQHSADRSGVSGRRARNADFACLPPSISGRPSGRHGRGPDHRGSSR